MKITYHILDKKSQDMTLLGRAKLQLKGTIKKDIIQERGACATDTLLALQ
jgi:hypothetical protein